MQVFNFTQGHVPLLISMPHTGTHVPDDIASRMTDNAKTLPDTDWFMDQLYGFASDMGCSMLAATHSRYVVDLNRPAEDVELYPGQVKTGLCPAETFAGDPIYQSGQEPDEAEKAQRIEKYWRPYHETLEAELQRMKSEHGVAYLYDAHSICSIVPRLFEGVLPDLNIGTNQDQSCNPALAARLLAVAAQSDFSAVLNGRFIGGHITRHYGDPVNNIHAVQMELAWKNYMDETPPYIFDDARAEKLQSVLRSILQTIIDTTLLD